MGKDTEQLSSISKFFDESTLKEILQKSSEEQDVEVTDWEFQGGVAKGDGYLSQVDRVTVRGLAKGKDVEVKLFIKSLPKNIGRRKTYRSPDFFNQEITFYNEIVPAFEKFLESKGQKKLFSVPTCLATLVDHENDYVVLQDMGALGYGPVARLTTIDFEQMSTLVKSMADFHAVSFAFKDQHSEQFNKFAKILPDTYFSDEHWNWYKNFHVTSMRVVNDALEKEYPGHPATLKFRSYDPPKKLWDKSLAFCARTDAPTAVVNQGDSWAPNFLLRNIGDSGEKQALLLDFQLARVASPILDLAFLVYACSDKKLLDDHFDDILDVYHSRLSESIRKLGSDPERLYPRSVFDQEVKEYWIHGLNFAMEAVPFSMLDENDAFDLDVLIKGDEAVDIADVWLLENIKTSEGRHRLADLIVHAYSRGFL